MPHVKLPRIMGNGIAGTIAELGTHDELLAHNGEYAALWRSWRSEASGAS